MKPAKKSFFLFASSILIAYPVISVCDFFGGGVRADLLLPLYLLMGLLMLNFIGALLFCKIFDTNYAADNNGNNFFIPGYRTPG